MLEPSLGLALSCHRYALISRGRLASLAIFVSLTASRKLWVLSRLKTGDFLVLASLPTSSPISAAAALALASSSTCDAAIAAFASVAAAAGAPIAEQEGE